MKKSLLFIAAAAATVLFMTSCQKEEVANQGFTARLENGNSNAKTILAGTHINWDFGNDQVEIYDADNAHGTFTATQHSNTTYSNDATCAELINTNVTLAETGGYKAIYPASIAQSNNTIILPRIQNSTNGELSEYPMYAESSTKSLQFKNLCSVLKLSLTGTETINKIEVVTDKYINGTFTIGSTSDGTPTLTPATITDHTKVTTLTMSTAQTLGSTAKIFYIYLPAQEYKYIKLNFYNQDNLVYSKAATITDGVTLERSKYHLLAISTPTFEPSVLCGEFSVSSNTKVSFSKGNLIIKNREYTEQTSSYSTLFGSRTYISATNTVDEYKFADNQYDIYATNVETNPTYAKWLFEWGRASNASTMFDRWNGYSYSTTTTVNALHNATRTDSYSGSLSGGGNINWRCLTQGEWDYLLRHFSRMTYYNKNGVQQNTSSYNRCFTLGTVNGVHGMLIFPDVFYWPLDNKEPTYFGQRSYTDWNSIVLTAEEWRIVEGAGCVFLPATGYIQPNIQGHRENDLSSNINNNAAYWASDGNNDHSPYWLKIQLSTSAFIDNNVAEPKGDYHAIRLVKNN